MKEAAATRDVLVGPQVSIRCAPLSGRYPHHFWGIVWKVDFDLAAFQTGINPVDEVVTMLDLDVAGYATVTADGIDISKAPEGVTFELLSEENERWSS